ncbi:MAG: NAD-dependent epimerase/dehydratase family protein [bacterium]|nr:NAD-dependent epimerase/dehydratase family protein [bacterium]
MVLLTGATGFLGTRLLLRLLEWKGQVRVIVRDPKALRAKLPEEYRSPGVVDIFTGDLTKPNIDFEKIYEGIDTIIHNAAIVKVSSERFKPMYAVNVRATERMLGAAPNDCYFLQIGSVVAYGPTGLTPVDENSPFPAKAISPYEATKREAVILARKRLDNGLPCGILNPGIIYGPGAKGSLTRFAHWVAHGKLPIFAGRNSLGSFVHIDDVVDTAIEMLKRRERDEFIAGGESLPMGEFLDLVATATGGKSPQFDVSPTLLAALTTIPSLLFNLFRSELPFTPTLFRTVNHHWAYSSAKAERLLGVRYRNAKTGIDDWVKAGSFQ